MILKSINLQNCRNLIEIALQFSSQFNFIFGDNGSGKTSLLEAIHLLSIGRSFRANNYQRIINENSEQLVIHAKLLSTSQQQHKIGFQRNIGQAKPKIKINGEMAKSSIQTASLMPVLLINQDSYRLLDSGPKFRRQFLDWGVFHVEPMFYQYWKNLQRILKQRNAALKKTQRYQQLQHWDEEFNRYAELVDELRQRYIVNFNEKVATLLSDVADFKVKMSYQRGWSADKSLLSCLCQQFQRDQQQGYTYSGPQRADLVIKVNKVPAHQYLSRGQQKLLVNILRIAQGLLYFDSHQVMPIYLFDDLPAELDQHYQAYLLNALSELNTQVFITGVDLGYLIDLYQAKPSTNVFHVKHGGVIEPIRQ